MTYARLLALCFALAIQKPPGGNSQFQSCALKASASGWRWVPDVATGGADLRFDFGIQCDDIGGNGCKFAIHTVAHRWNDDLQQWGPDPWYGPTCDPLMTQCDRNSTAYRSLDGRIFLDEIGSYWVVAWITDGPTCDPASFDDTVAIQWKYFPNNPN